MKELDEGQKQLLPLRAAVQQNANSDENKQ